MTNSVKYFQPFSLRNTSYQTISFCENNEHDLTCDSMPDGKIRACASLIRILSEMVFQPGNQEVMDKIWSYGQVVIEFEQKCTIWPFYYHIWVWDFLSVQLNIGDLAFASKFHGEHIFIPAMMSGLVSNNYLVSGFMEMMGFIIVLTWFQQASAMFPAWEQRGRLSSLGWLMSEEEEERTHTHTHTHTQHTHTRARAFWAASLPEGHSGNWQR